MVLAATNTTSTVKDPRIPPSTSKLAPATVWIVATTVSTWSVYWTYQQVKTYGWDGLFRCIWEGDPYPPHIRHLLNILNDASHSCRQLEAGLIELEQALAKALIDVADSSNPPDEEESWRQIHTLWGRNADVSDLGTYLANISHQLDQTTARVDEIPAMMFEKKESMRQNSFGGVDAMIRLHKKDLSKRLVGLMEQADVLVTYWNDKGSVSK